MAVNRNRKYGACIVLSSMLMLIVGCTNSNESEFDKAKTYLNDLYPASDSQARDFGCSVGPSTAAGLDWNPGLGFSLDSLERAWEAICG
jgi:hypothetical protein